MKTPPSFWRRLSMRTLSRRGTRLDVILRCLGERLYWDANVEIWRVWSRNSTVCTDVFTDLLCNTHRVVCSPSKIETVARLDFLSHIHMQLAHSKHVSQSDFDHDNRSRINDTGVTVEYLYNNIFCRWSRLVTSFSEMSQDESRGRYRRTWIYRQPERFQVESFRSFTRRSVRSQISTNSNDFLIKRRWLMWKLGQRRPTVPTRYCKKCESRIKTFFYGNIFARHILTFQVNCQSHQGLIIVVYVAGNISIMSNWHIWHLTCQMYIKNGPSLPYPSLFRRKIVIFHEISLTFQHGHSPASDSTTTNTTFYSLFTYSWVVSMPLLPSYRHYAWTIIRWIFFEFSRTFQRFFHEFSSL